ncbi:MAG: peptidoglycan-associated lipoprotein [Bradymonadia bacterium]|jgi:peptidoglycan-associated lipoprotein
MRVITICLLAVTFVACAGRPTATLTEARTALDGAVLAKKCAPEDYAAAERMYTKAQTLAAQGKNEEAKQAAEAAKKLAFQARKKAEARRAECFAPKDQKNPTDVDQFVDRSQPDVVVGAGVEEMKTVFFNYNAFELSPEGRETLTRNAGWMTANIGSTIVIEGHCDSRGSSEYNLALGEKRGQVAQRYLKQLGVDEARLQVTSYGEERPADYGEGESSFARNRRVEFTVR